MPRSVFHVRLEEGRGARLKEARLTRSTLVRIAISVALCHLAALPAAAQAPTAGTFHLDTELYRSVDGAFGEVRLEEDGLGGLHFMVTLDPAEAGENAQLKNVFLSLGDQEGWPAGLHVVPDEPDDFAMYLAPQRHGFFSMGANFGGVVSIYERHDHPHSRGWFRRSHHHDSLMEVGFTLMADAPLTLDDVMAIQSSWRGDMAQIAVYTNHTKLGSRFRSMALLGGLFEADPPPPPPPVEDDDADDEEEDDGGMGGGLPDDGQVPPGCAGIYDSVTGELIMVFCP